MVSVLILINTFIFLLEHISFIPLPPLGIFSFNSPDFHIYQLITHIFYHQGFFHLFFNMLILYFFGNDVELRIGKENFLYLYLGSGILASIIGLLLYHDSNIYAFGASGAVFGVMCFYGMMYPNREVRLFFLIPIKIKYLISIIMIIQLYQSILEDNLSSLVHLIGGILGIAFYYLIKSRLYNPYKKVKRKNPIPIEKPSLDDVLDKIGRFGIKSLSKEEVEVLKNQK